MGKPERIVLVVFVCVVGLLLRAGFVAETHVKDPLRADAGQYAQYAHNLVEHGVYSLDEGEEPKPDSFRSPGYPLFLAAARVVAGEDGWYALARWVQVVLGAAMVPLAFVLGRRLVGYGPALVGAALVALSPHLVTSTAYVLTETLAGITLLVGLLLSCRVLQRGGSAMAALAGVVLGFAALVNEALLLLPLPVAVLLWRRAPGNARRCAWALLLGFASLAGTWTVRNHVQVQDPDRAGSQRALITLSHGTYPGWVLDDPRLRYSAYLGDPEQPEFGTSWSRFAEVLGRRIGQRPLRYLSWYLLEKPYWLWSWSILQGQGDCYVYPVADSLYETQPVANASRVAMKALHPIVLLLLLVGFVRGVVVVLRRRSLPPAGALLTLTLGYVTVIYMVFAPWPRYSVPLRPELYVFAVWTACSVAATAFARRHEPAPATA